MRIKQQSDVSVGDPVSYQSAGMTAPKHGVVTGIPHLSHGLFVRYEGEQRGRFEDIAWLRKGHLKSWYKEVPHPSDPSRTAWSMKDD